MGKIIKNITDGKERAFYASTNVDFENINISGIEDGESAFKECKNIKVNSSHFELRYPFWHNDNLKVNDSIFLETCRAPLWYSNNVSFDKVSLFGVKAFRECKNITITYSKLNSEEIFWRTSNIKVNNSEVKGFYAFFECSNIIIKDVGFDGKYSFQYVNNAQIEDSTLNTKDAFWHSKNVTVRNCIIKGEYLGWYSQNLTLIDCKIEGTQPLCYAKGLKLINCTMDGCDLAFEYSEVNGIIVGKVKSIKNPLKGSLTIQECEEFIQDENDRSNGQFNLMYVE